MSHCFNLTLRDGVEEVNGIDGLCEAYKKCLNSVQLYGPTYFSEILNNVAAKSSNICSQQSQTYNILLIITDGVINDMQRSIDAIVDATHLPLSIIIVGVGNADFTNMEILDADDNPLRHSHTGKVMQRDIVQFVPFNDFKNQHISAIARETLEEVPGQVTSFMSMRNIYPNPPQVEQSKSQGLYDNIHHHHDDDDKKEPQYDDQVLPTAPYTKSGNNPYYQEGKYTAPGYVGRDD